MQSNKLKASVAIIQVLHGAHLPLDSQNILQHVAKIAPHLNRATIFRNLNILVTKKQIKKVNLGEDKFRYELEGEHHHHLVCDKCGKIEPYDYCALPMVENKIFEQTGFKVSAHQLEFFGTCKKCFNK